METPKEQQDETKASGSFRDRWRQMAVFLVGAVVVALYFGGYLHMPDPLQGKPAKAFSLSSLDGGEVNLANHIGKDVVLLDFWAVWCPPCRKSIPALADIAGEFAPKGLVVYAVNQQDTPERVNSFLKSENITVPVLMDPESVAGDLYGVSSIPKIVLIDRTGTIVFTHGGYGPGAGGTIRRAVDKALQ
jgi:peroxiredoxin